MDMRGAGASTPRLNCPAVTRAHMADLATPLSPSPKNTHRRRTTALLLACRDRHQRQGTDLADFTTAAAATDAKTLRRLLKIPRWRLIAYSHGTRLAAHLIRQDPDGTHSAVLDSPVPSDARLLPPPYLFHRAATLIAADCRLQPHCRRHGDLLANLQKILTPRPPTQTPTPILTLTHQGTLHAIALTPLRTAELLYFGLYDDLGAAILPILARQLAAGKTDTAHLEHTAHRYLDITSDPDWATLLNWHVNCQENPHPPPLPAPAPNAPWQQLEKDAWRDYAATCAALAPPESHESPESPLTLLATQKPILLLSGAYDPATPPTWAATMAARLPNARHLVIPAAHTPSAHHPCLRRTIHAFFRTPSAKITPQCPPTPLTFH